MHDNIDDLAEPEIGAVTALVDEDGQLIITQDGAMVMADQPAGSLILTPSSLLHVIHQTTTSSHEQQQQHHHHHDDHQANGHDVVDDQDVDGDGERQWAFEVVIDPRA